MSHSVIVFVEGTSRPILLELLSAKNTLPVDESTVIETGRLELVGMPHSVIVFVEGTSRPILLELLSTKNTLPVDESTVIETGRLELVGIPHSVIVFVEGSNLPILLELLSTKNTLLPLNELAIEKKLLCSYVGIGSTQLLSMAEFSSVGIAITCCIYINIIIKGIDIINNIFILKVIR